ncbi:MAG: HPr family phosphocarrier protein [Clostridiales bacterium]|nr:HPr family phosphocarrier protein [Clostridiales bacterium]
MKQFTHIVQTPHGLHARPAGLLAKQAKTYADTVITLTKGDKTVRAGQLLRVLNLGIQCGDAITVTAEGAEEDTAWNDMQAFFLLNL